MRGKVVEVDRYQIAFGITPACAGKSCGLQHQSCRSRDHPRMCGEKAAYCTQVTGYTGSPPHVRGKALVFSLHPRFIRITPACAGKSLSCVVSGRASQDHPRMCGEKALMAFCKNCAVGSPPHVRGKADHISGHNFCVGITPACAGKRLKRSRSTVPPVAIVPLFPSVCNKPVVSDGSPAGRDAPLFLPAENAVPASPAYNLRSL